MKIRKRSRRKRDAFSKADMFLVLFAIFASGLCLLLIIKNSLIKNIFNEQVTSYEGFELDSSRPSRVIEAELDSTKRETVKMVDDEKFLIKPPEIQRIEEEFKDQQQKLSRKKKVVKLYFIKVTAEGHFLKQDVKRTIHYDKNILEETLKALINGPNEYELKNNYLSLVPINTKILNLSISDGVAHINLSKEFYENSFGVEGTINQVSQIILTCLEIQGINGITLRIENNPIILEDLNLDFSGILDKRIF
ncbi:GerMN domain-containing protein [Borrelia sp. BU AG58]|nr:GerMN domain-containing protein [Borrelia sp. BU AG58]